jgi:AcrR family transcriptional regulator
MRDPQNQTAAPREEGLAEKAAPGSQGGRERILDAAETLFAERGFAGTAMRDIARAVDMKPASIYSHFSGKQALYEAVLARGLLPLSDLLEGLSGSEWSEQQLGTQMDALIEYLRQRPRALRLIIHEALAGGESLMPIARQWLRPLYDSAVTTFRESGGGVLRAQWQEDELPLLIASLLYLILGHFAVPPTLAEVFGDDPLSPRGLSRHTEFLRKIIPIVLFSDESAVEVNTQAPGAQQRGRTGGAVGKK